MRSELFTQELAGVIRRLESRITRDPKYARLFDVDTPDEALQHTLDGIEDAIAGLVMLHIQLRRPK